MFRSLRIIFAGTSEFAAHHLNALLLSKHQIVGVFTQPDKPVGRGKKIMPTPVKLLAYENNLPIFQPNSLHKSNYQELITKLNADIMIVVAYGLLIPENVLKIPRLGCINIHCSLLPRWRGAAPVQYALLSGDVKTGITIIQMDIGLDTGDILYKKSCPIANYDTSRTLYIKLAHLGEKGIIKTLQQLSNNSIKRRKQDEKQVTYAKKISKNEARIDWSLPAIKLERCIRAFNPWPISWLEVCGQLVKIWKASVIKSKLQFTPGTILDINKKGIQVATIENILNIELLQFAGKTIISIQDLLNSNKKLFTINKLLN